jgi:hypothetical protein
MRTGVLLIEEGTNVTATNASERATNATTTNKIDSAPSKKTISNKKKDTCHQKSAFKSDAEVLSDSSYDIDLAASSDSDDD